jgi:CheY-like chemotaxis protein
MLKPEMLDVNAIVIGMGATLRGLLGGGIELVATTNARHPWTNADASQIQQVLTSLAHNARDAMPHGGKLTLETADVTLAADDASRTAQAAPGDYVMIAVTDTGAGIADDVKEHLFEPFFTTKAPGEGKGLALAMCHGILKQSGGHISVESQTGRGATFRIYLPRCHEAQPGQLAMPDPAGAILPALQGKGMILLVEEDATLRSMAGTVLEKQGYTVRPAASSREAMSIAGRLARVDLLLADAVMPEMSGKELAQWLCSSRPAMKVVFTSAFDKDHPAHQAILDSGAEVLCKPYTPGMLSQKVRDALGGEGREAEEKIAG